MLLRILKKNINKRLIIFFFPYYHIGGSEKAHLNIVKCFKDYKKIIFFTDRSRDRRYKKEFKKNAFCINLFGIPNKIKLVEKVLIFFLSFFLNKTSGITVFGSNSRFFYRLIDRLNSDIKKIDLVHWIDGYIGSLTLDKTDKIDKRVIITPEAKKMLQEEYEKRDIDLKNLNKLYLIENCIYIPGALVKKQFKKLKVLYVGRNSYEKRPELIYKIWEKLQNANIDFKIIGRGMKKVSSNTAFNNIVIEKIDSESGMSEVYNEFHIIIMTSLFEGFPFAFMEAMSRGVVPISTRVGGVPYHLKHGVNSFLIDSNKDEEIIDFFVKKIFFLNKNREFLKKLSQNAFNYAKNNFSCNDKYCLKYKEIITKT